MTDRADMCEFDAAADANATPNDLRTSEGCTYVEVYVLIQEGNPKQWRMCTSAARHAEGWMLEWAQYHPNGPTMVLTLIEERE